MPTPSAPAGSSAASNVRRLKNLDFTALPVPFPLGAVAALAISPVDGSLYAVSQTSPAGMAPDGFIYHLVGSTWINMPGIASSIAVGADGVVYAVVASQHGQVYAYVPAGWLPGTGATPIPGGPTWYPLVSYNGAQGTSSGQLPSPQPVAASQVIAASLGGTTDFPVILASAAPGADAAVYTWGTTISGDPYYAWGQMPGAGISLARGSLGGGIPVPTPPPSGAPLYTWFTGGFFLVNSYGALYKWNVSGPPPWTSPYQVLPQNGASPIPALAAVTDSGDATGANLYGLLAGTSASNPGPVWQYSSALGYWFNTGSQAVSTVLTGGICGKASGVCSSPQPVYAYGALGSGGSPAVGSATPAPPPTTIPFSITIDAAAGPSGATPKMNPANTYITIIGQPVTSAQGYGKTAWVQVTDTKGDTAAWANNGTAVATQIPFCATPGCSALTSQTIQLPWLNSARVYISYDPAPNATPLPITLSSGPAPWNGDGSQKIYFDYIEYSWVPQSPTGKLGDPNIYVDTTQVNEMGLPIQMTLTDASGATHQTGVLAGAFTKISGALATASASSAGAAFWNALNGQWPYRILSPDGPVFAATAPANGVALTPGALDSSLLAVWNYYVNQTLTITDPGGPLAGHVLVGEVAGAGGDFVFHEDTLGGTAVARIPSPFNPAYQFGGSLIVYNSVKYPYAATWGTATQTVLQQNGPFLAPTSVTVGPTPSVPQPMPTTTTYAFPENALYPSVAQTVGNKVSTAMNRGVFGSSAYPQISCEAQPVYFPATGQAFFNWYAYEVSNVLSNPVYGYGQSYSIPYNDQCGLSTTISSPTAAALSATIHPF